MSGEHTHPELIAATAAVADAHATSAAAVAARITALETAADESARHLVLGDKQNNRTIYTNTAVKLDIRGATSFLPPPGGGQRILGLYANVWLPKPRTVDRERIWRGGWRAWFQQADTTEADGQDETGFLGPVMVPKMGDGSLLITHTWAHGVTDGKPWEFVIEVRAFGSDGKPRRVPLTLGTRGIKIVAV